MSATASVDVKAEFESLLDTLKGDKGVPDLKNVIAGKMFRLMGALVDDATEVPANVFETLDAETRKVVVMAFLISTGEAMKAVR